MRPFADRYGVPVSSITLLCAFTALAQGRLPAGVTHATTVEGVAEYRLDNGLRVLLFRDPSKATITVNMTYFVGSLHESYGETGMAHLLEHMPSSSIPMRLARLAGRSSSTFARPARRCGSSTTSRRTPSCREHRSTSTEPSAPSAEREASRGDRRDYPAPWTKLLDEGLPERSQDLSVRLSSDTRRLSIRETDAFDLGWDHGIYRVAPGPDLPAAVREGYLAALESREPKHPDRFVRKWLQVRGHAMLRGIQVDAAITPATLESLDSTTCPISGVLLTHGECADTDWSVDRVLNRYSYRPGNLLIVSSRINRAKGALELAQIGQIASSPESHSELEAWEWRKLAEIVEMFELAEDGDPPNGLPRLTGALPVNGLRLSSVAFWQYCLTLAVCHDDAHLLELAVSQLPGVKPVRRAAVALLKELARRVNGRAEPFSAWTSARLQKRLDALLELLPTSWYRRHAALSEQFFSSHLGLVEARQRLRGVRG